MNYVTTIVYDTYSDFWVTKQLKSWGQHPARKIELYKENTEKFIMDTLQCHAWSMQMFLYSYHVLIGISSSKMWECPLPCLKELHHQTAAFKHPKLWTIWIQLVEEYGFYLDLPYWTILLSVKRWDSAIKNDEQTGFAFKNGKKNILELGEVSNL